MNRPWDSRPADVRHVPRLKELNEEGMTILLIEQNANLALKFAHRGYVIDTGEIVAQGSSAELLEDPEVKKAYLGG